MRLGAHMSTAGGAWKALTRGHSISCEAVQIFLKNNMQWFGRPPSAREASVFKAERKRTKISAVFGHTSYLINLGAAPSANREKSIRSLIQEMECATILGVPFVVMHPGAHLGAGEKMGLQRIVSGLNEVFAATRGSRTRIALEITAGQGTCLGCKLEHLAAIIEAANNPERLGVCLDTAHLFAAGYDIRRPVEWDAVIKRLTGLIGLRKILAFHLNDSKTDLGSHVDRHAHIGHGKIGLTGFQHIVNDARFRKHPACLETPKGPDLKEDIQNLALLRSLRTV